MGKIFISYSRKDKGFVDQLVQNLEENGFEVWIDRKDIVGGERWRAQIVEAIRSCDAFLIILSPQSVASDNVAKELALAEKNQRRIIPVVFQDCVIPAQMDYQLAELQQVSMVTDYQRGLQKLVKAMGAKSFVPPANPPTPNPQNVPTMQNNKPVGTSLPRQLAFPAIIGGIVIIFIVIIVAFIRLPSLLSANSTPIPLPANPTSNIIEVTKTIQVTTNNFVSPTETSKPVSPSTRLPASSPTIKTDKPEITDSKGVSMRLVSAGKFIMGSESGESDEKPQHDLYLDAFYMDKYELTNALYADCVKVGACQPPKDSMYFSKPEYAQHPVVFVDWYMAKTYCSWRGARLPTEAEWEKAARGSDGRTYPWGETIDCSYANYRGANNHCVGKTSVVGSYESGKSIFGVYDMAGNVAEWVSSLNASYPYNKSDGRENLNASGDRILRGGSWNNKGMLVRTTDRAWNIPTTTAFDYGFRCAKNTQP